MKKLLKITGIFLLSVIGLVGLLLIYIALSDIPTYKVEKIEYAVTADSASIARGHKLVSMLCVNCHMNKQTGKLTGKKMVDVPTECGEIYSQNITQDNTYGIGEWTDGEIVFLLRTGIKRNGQYSPPYMAKLPNMADEDINAILSFLKSDHHMVAPDPTPDIQPRPSFLTKLLSRIAFKPFAMPTEKIELPDQNNAVELGKYLAHNLDCFACHSSDFATVDYLVPENSIGYFGGGNQPLDEQGRVMRTPNITPHMEHGIGSWSRDDFIKAVKYGLVEGESALAYPMVPFIHLSDHEAGAIYEYLQTIPPLDNKVERSVYN